MSGSDGAAGRQASPRTRREVLAAAGATGLVGLAGCGGDGDGNGDGGNTTPTETNTYANYPVEGDTVKIGVSIPETGVYSGEGEQLLAGYELAAQNINEGRGFVNNETFSGLGETSGILGKDIELVVENSGSGGDQATDSAEELIDDQGVIMLTGGGSTDEAVAHQAVASDRSVIHMVGFAPGDVLSGENCAAVGFQELFNASAAAEAIRPVVVGKYGEDLGFAQIRPRTDVGETFQNAMRNSLEQAGWNQRVSRTTRVGTQNFEGPFQEAIDRDPDVLVLNYWGLDGAHAIRQADEMKSDDMEIVVPMFNRPMARNAGAAMAGVIGTVHWDSSIIRPVSQQFSDAWTEVYTAEEDEVATRPSGLAHLAYNQLFKYATAVERAGSFEPPAVVSELEGMSYDIGMGSQEIRACDHQSKRPIPVVEGLPDEDQDWGRYYERRQTVRGAVPGCDKLPASDCSMGSL